MFKKILIANRGEIALRIIRACKELGIQTVAVYSEPDIESLHVQLADEAICIGKAPSSESYLKIDRIISAAEIADADAIHPGYGFLAENAHFADVCASCNIKFIGPPANAIRLMGDKNSARECARKAGVPVSPGSDGTVDTEAEALKIAKKIGFPVMIKAVAGGGGRGMRIATDEATLINGYHSARHEAEKAFGNAAVYIEKFIVNPHHIEFQVFGDEHGRIVHLGERDCSLQRRNQKIVEECPSPLMRQELRDIMGNASIRLAETVGYANAGTMEFLVDDDGNFYFMEMNTRIQVEHPITEEVYGCDLVKQQIQVATGEHLSEHVINAKPRHHAIECRINAEDPERNFMPCPGLIELYYAPGGRGVRIDSHAYAGYPIPPNYDSMIAKVITTASTRKACIARMSRSLNEYMITGVKTTIPFQQQIMQNADFLAGKYNTGFVEKLLQAGR
ncbi:acetyl-CoA carboxylase, biotin carboxylase subunit [Terrimicrobium sacchariphilum]|uniref:Biotin carboxylase n=1 Tax=Terrimicrobium sacchariphilum TaxID=690879 RepID=A0A146GBU8_TERSA|nr:acetyl-CoA carboxylase biotin carboxylase subunit [Terrimicrobium sacchariphilum]GAT35089.1 acetyl-CoA carboxylase, biotin carboxylase subunit [Terrimicrobium sacchariphilum]